MIIQMAITVNMEKKLKKIDIVRISTSHGWMIPASLWDIKDKNIPPGERPIKVYTIIANGSIVTYQPDMDEMTIVSPSEEIEKKAKQDVPDIFIKQKLGTIIKDVDAYFNMLNFNGRILKDVELNKLIDEVRGPDLRYIQ